MARSVLVVEDDNNIADLLRMYLEKEGFSVRIAGDGGTALQEFAKAAPDLILLDVMLPVMDGWGVLRRVRETSRVPVIMLTAKGETFDKVQRAWSMGADDYVVKPFEMPRKWWPASRRCCAARPPRLLPTDTRKERDRI